MADTVKKIMGVAYGDVKKVGPRLKANIKKLFRSKGEQTGTSTIIGCDVDGFANQGAADGFSLWENAIADTSASNFDSASAGSGYPAETLYVSVSRGSARSSRAYFRFTGFESDITSVTAATLKVHFNDVNDLEATEDGAIKWKAFKHNDLSTSIDGGTFRNDNDSAGWNQSISGSEATISEALTASFPITDDLLSYVSTQAQAGGKVAFMLVSKFDYLGTSEYGPSDANSVKISFTESDDEPQLEYSWTK